MTNPTIMTPTDYRFFLIPISEEPYNRTYFPCRTSAEFVTCKYEPKDKRVTIYYKESFKPLKASVAVEDLPTESLEMGQRTLYLTPLGKIITEYSRLRALTVIPELNAILVEER